MKSHRLLAIDPGLQGTGFAIWTKQAPRPSICGVIQAPSSKRHTWIARVDFIAEVVASLTTQYRIDTIICEMMEHYNTASSAMAWSKGDLQRTMMLIGTIHGLTLRQGVEIILVTPREWKGQLPKSVTIARVRRVLTDSVCNRLGIKTHAWDAVGIGLWHRGVIK